MGAATCRVTRAALHVADNSGAGAHRPAVGDKGFQRFGQRVRRFGRLDRSPQLAGVLGKRGLGDQPGERGPELLRRGAGIEPQARAARRDTRGVVVLVAAHRQA